jgi:tRNA(Phe) wybutosine-synthesizing methylase Tyw3
MDEILIKNFTILKAQNESMNDASRKASIDAPIRTLIESINNSENYFTTSSCSGRFLAFSQVKNFPSYAILNQIQNMSFFYNLIIKFRTKILLRRIVNG